MWDINWPEKSTIKVQGRIISSIACVTRYFCSKAKTRNLINLTFKYRFIFKMIEVDETYQINFCNSQKKKKKTDIRSLFEICFCEKRFYNELILWDSLYKHKFYFENISRIFSFFTSFFKFNKNLFIYMFPYIYLFFFI